jgi:hypothetical protein
MSETVHKLMFNTYELLTNRITQEEIDDKYDGLLFTEPNESTVSLLIKYFESIEMYEICGELLKIYGPLS